MKGAIMLSGGGSGKLFAAIGVTYPAGSTLTCTNGEKTLKAKTTTGQWVFAIPEAGTWTVTATDGTNTKSQRVSITSEGQFETVTLSYQLHLFEAGVGLASDYSIGKDNLDVTTTADIIRLTRAGDFSSGQAYFSPAVDCSQYNKVTIVGRCSKFADGYSWVRAALTTNQTTDYNGSGVVATVSINALLTTFESYSMDLSGIEETLYLNIYCERGTDVEITDILFE